MSEEVVDRYVTFKNINCYLRAKEVLEHVVRVVNSQENPNPFWKNYIEKMPESFYTGVEDEELIYHVCANVFYIDDLFERAGDEAALAIMDKAEFDCC